MFPSMLFRSFRPDNSRKKKSQIHVETDEWSEELQLHHIQSLSSVPFKTYPLMQQQQQQLKHSTTHFSLMHSHIPTPTARNARIKPKKMSKVSNFSALIQRATAACLLHPLASDQYESELISDLHESHPVDDNGAGLHQSRDEKYKAESEEEQGDDDDGEKERLRLWEDGEAMPNSNKVMEIVILMGEVFDAVSAVKRAYVSLQGAHCPWDPDKMRVADVAVVAELRRLGVLRERFRRGSGGWELVCGGGGRRSRRMRFEMGGMTLREVVAPYEAVVEELKTEVKAKETEIENLREKLKTASINGGGGGKKGQSKRKVGGGQPQMSPAPELFETTMGLVIEASKSFTSLLLSLMRSAHWDIASAVRSIESSNAADPTDKTSLLGAHHGKYVLESYVNRKIFQGFDHETFYMDGSLSSLLHPDQFRRDCFTQYRDMKSMDPVEILGILPTCHFGKFCSKKYLSIVHPKMEESLFGDLEQRRRVVAGNHPRNQFYGEFSRLAKAVWLLHLLAFAMDPPPSHFEASQGAEFHPDYMENVVRIAGGRGGGVGGVVGVGMSPGFKLGNGSIIKARVYLVPRT